MPSPVWRNANARGESVQDSLEP